MFFVLILQVEYDSELGFGSPSLFTPFSAGFVFVFLF